MLLFIVDTSSYQFGITLVSCLRINRQIATSNTVSSAITMPTETNCSKPGGGSQGVRILELSNRAWELYEKQEMAERRRLLDFVFSNSTWAGGKLTPHCKKPFDLISEAVRMQAEEEARTGKKLDETAQNENWLPWLDDFRTFLAMAA